MAAQYTYGTGPTAASRLEDIGEFFNPLAAALVREFVTDKRDVAVDLGCGPGFTTRMLADAADCVETYGLDNSPDFLESASARFQDLHFLRHDLTQVPFPVAGDVMYARFVLCHLPNPLDLITAWSSQLRPGGLLFIDEIDTIETRMPVFATYLDVAQGIVGSQHGSLYLGGILSSACRGAEVLHNECTTLSVPNRQAASWFLPNARTVWNVNEWVSSNIAIATRRTVVEELERLMSSQDSHSDITWRLRSIVLKNKRGLG